MNYIEELQDVIKRLHGTEATYVETVPVKETFEGQTVWEGEVEVFDLADHPLASRVYAWAYDREDESKPTQHVTVLQIPPATTPQNAVKASIVAEYKAQND
jgi:hypothetical protein